MNEVKYMKNEELFLRKAHRRAGAKDAGRIS